MSPSANPIPLYVGTSGWSYPHWGNGVFYPQKLPSKDWLSFYAHQFPTVEINMTFYRLPQEKLLQQWYDRTPENFIFSVKLWRRITHDKRLQDCSEELETFFKLIQPLQQKRGPILIQLPPSFKYNLPVLENFFQIVETVCTGTFPSLVIEFRNDSWLCDDTNHLLNKWGITRCIADMPRCTVTEPNETTLVYVRRHGPKGTYRGSYPSEQLQQDAKNIRNWLKKGKTVFIYFNNDFDGFAVQNARDLLRFVTKKR